MKLKKTRKNKKIPLSFIAKKLGISRDRLMRIEDGQSDLPTRCIITLSKIYGISELEIIRFHMEDLSVEKR